MRTKLLAIVGVIAVFAMTGIASAQTNLLTNGTFTVEGTDPLNAAGWLEVNNGGWVTREVNPGGPYGDTNELHYAIGNSGGINNYVYQDVPGTAGLSYQLTADGAMDDWWSPAAFLRLVFLDGIGTELSTNQLDFVANGFDGAVAQPWTNRIITGVAPSGTVTVRAMLGGYTSYVNPPGSTVGDEGGTIRFDNAELISFNPVIDTDGDGLPDYWENNNGLDPFDDGTTNINNGAIGDPDGDLLVNSNEFALGTNPQVADTDGDGLTDADEVNSTLTDPLDADSDDDYLTDGAESTNHLTNPLLADTDSDGVNDATEVHAGSDPNVLASVPVNALPDVIGMESFYYNNGAFGPQGGGELFDYDNNVSNDAYTGHTGSSSGWDATWGTSFVTAGRLETRESGMIRALNGVGTGGEDLSLFAQKAITPEVDSEVLYAKVEMTLDVGVSWGGLSLFDNGLEKIFFGVGDDGTGSNLVFGINEHLVSTNTSSIDATDNQTYTMVVAMDANLEVIDMWIDPDLLSPAPISDVTLSFVTSTNLRCTAIRLASGGSGSIYWDNLVVGTTWDSLSTVSSDSDSDGLPDAWEIYYGLDPFDDGTTFITNGPAGDPDGDTLLNSSEFAPHGTDPMLADTDYDGLDDDVEVNTTLTDPLVWDTDGDGLNDGDEVNIHLTNPLLVDTDSDGEDDWFEIFQGTDPTDIASTSASEGVAIVDGTLDAAYGAALTVQTVNTSWEDNLDELDAAYAYVKNDRLYLMLTGNMNTNWHKLEIFIDSSDAVTTNVFTAVGDDSTSVMDGLVFDAGFSPDYHINARVGTWEGAGGFNFNLDFYDLAATNTSYHQNAFDNAIEGSQYMGPGDATSNIVALAFNNTNAAGVVADGVGSAANQAAALAVTTGFECSIALADLGNPSGEIRIMAMVASNEHANVSNQILPGVPPVQGELGTTSGVDFGSYAGDQFFSVAVPFTGSPEILSGQLISGNTLFELNVSQLVVGADYKVQETADLTTSFADVPGSDWTAATTNDIVTVPADTGTNPEMFYQVVSP